METVIGQGAEATIILKEDTVIKKRLPKKYRHPKIDEELIRTRTRKETKILKKLKDIAPKLIETNEQNTIKIQYIKGELLKNILDENTTLAKQIGKNTAKIHDKNIIHGDLTTSNMILQDPNDNIKNTNHKPQKIIFIDFGLSFTSTKTEDKAVDLHLFKEAIESKHHRKETEIWQEFLKGYKPKNKEEILKRLNKVELRGRNKTK